MTDLEILKRELEFAQKGTAALPHWKQEVIRRGRAVEVSLGFIDQSVNRSDDERKP